MHERYHEPITLKNLAAEVFVSPFHFSRTFSKITGVTPGRYLTAVRVFEAKRLLLTTSLTISTIVCSVGYSSVGTFTSRFTRSVGMTPTQYRSARVGELLIAMSPHFQRMPSPAAVRELAGPIPPQRRAGSVATRIEIPPEFGRSNLLIGVFADSIPQRGPAAFAYSSLDGSTTEPVIANVPAGQWFILAIAEHPDATAVSDQFSIGIPDGPIAVVDGEVTRADVGMRRMRPIDPPIAVSLGNGGRPGFSEFDRSELGQGRIPGLPATAGPGRFARN